MQTLSDLKFYRDTYNVKLSARQRQLLVAVHTSTQKGFPTPSQWIAVEYGITVRAVRVVMSKVRRALKGTGWTISTNKGGAHTLGAYMVVRG